MPIFMDRHNVPGATVEDVRLAHKKDEEMQAEHKVSFLTYWFDQKSGCVFCLVDAPDKESLTKVHSLAHGLIPADIIEVDLTNVEAFLGRNADPKAEKSPDGKEYIPIGSAFRCILFTDLQGSSSMSRAIGDTAAMDLLDSHDKIIRGALATYRGREIKHTGDGIMASFKDVADSLKCAVAIQRSFHEFNKGNPRIPLHVRIGINAGEPVERGMDLFGMTVQLAARTCDHAKPEHILVTGVIYELSRNEATSGVSFKKVSKKAYFKGFESSLQLYEVNWQAEEGAR
jgi:class 3 adenylate cyclase